MATPQNELPAASLEKFTGLYKSVGRFAIPPGAMQEAENLVIPGGSLLTLRRGFESTPSAYADCLSLGFYGALVCSIPTADLLPPGFAINDGTTEWACLRDFSDFAFTPARLQAAGSSLPAMAPYREFLTSDGNVYVTGLNFGMAVSELPSTPTQQEGWAPAGTSTPTLTGGFSFVAGTAFPGATVTQNNIYYKNGSQVSYRATFRYTDANGNVHRGPPSEKLIIQYTNAGTSTAIRISVNEAPMVRPGTIVELWRTFYVPLPDDQSDATGDECFKIAELAITGTTSSLSDGYLVATGVGTPFATYDDNTPNTPYLVEPLYTNPTTGALNGLGIGNANARPPAAYDTFQFKGYTYFANTQEVQSLQVQIIGTGAGGIVDGDTFTVDGVAYQWKDVAPAAAGYIFVQLARTGGTIDKGSVVENLRWSARYAADAINKGNGFYSPAFNALGLYNALADKIYARDTVVNGMPGFIAMSRLVPVGPAFSVVAGTGAGRGWAGSLAVANSSDPNRQPNGLMQSQYGDPESVPPAFTETVGHSDSAILAGVPLRDTCLLYKTAPDGLWKFTDDGSGNLTLSALDPTVNLIAPKTAVFLDNAAFALCDKGVLKVTDGGAPENISDEKLRLELADLIAHVGMTTLASVAFAVAYESEKLYILCLPEAANATTCTIQYVYNVTTDAWTTWNIPNVQSGGVGPVNKKLYIGRNAGISGGDPIWLERKSNTDDDYYDPTSRAPTPGRAPRPPPRSSSPATSAPFPSAGSRRATWWSTPPAARSTTSTSTP